MSQRLHPRSTASYQRPKLNRDDANDHDLGDINGVQLSRPEGDKTWLLMTTWVWREPCASNASIYLYEWQRDGWTRRFELEEPLEGVERVEVGQPGCVLSPARLCDEELDGLRVDVAAVFIPIIPASAVRRSNSSAATIPYTSAWTMAKLIMGALSRTAL